MASYPNQEARPLKKPRFGAVGPDVYPQESKQKEDELNHPNVKHGFLQPSFDDEYKTAKEKVHELTDEKINKFFNNIIAEKTKINTVGDSVKRKLSHNIREIFWPVTQGSKAEPWLKDLAGTKPLTTLSKKVPIFNKKDDIFKNLCDYNVPMKRAVWFIKMTNSYHAALAESRVRNRGKQVDPCTDWAQVTKDFLKTHLLKIIDHHQGSSVQSLTVTSVIDQSMKYWNYGTQLAKHLYERGLLERHDFLSFFLEQIEKQKAADDTVLKLILGQILRYLSEYVQSQLLARKLAYFCCKKISTLSCESGCSSPRTQSPSLTTTANGAVATASGNISPQPQNGVISVFKEYNSCPQHRGLLLSLSVIIQAVVMRCPGSLIWHNHGEGKMTSPLSGSPLDLLPCSPSCLPIAPGMDNHHLRDQIRRCEMQVTLRSRMSESRWSSDKCQQSAKGFTISKILQVLDKLDRQNFAKIEVNSFLDCLYNDVFGVLQSKENEPPISDEPIVNLLCEWAVSTQRTGEYRPLIVAKLLEKRQNTLNAEKYADEDIGDKGSDAGSDVMASGGVPVFQGLLLSFLDNKAPYLEDLPSPENKNAFCNLIHLFSELIIHDVFSHDAYMCTLISRGDLADAPTLRVQPGSGMMDHTDISSVRSELPRHETPRGMDIDPPHLDQDFDYFAFKDDAKSSPCQPASVKSMGPFSVPTPGQAQTPIAQTPGGMARTPGGPTTPIGKGARTPGAPHTPGAHTPGKATTPLGAGGLTPGMAHTPGLTPGGPTTPSRTPVHGGPHTPGIVAYLSGSGGHHSVMSSHTPRMSQTPRQQQANQSLTEDTALKAKKHLCYAMHFPIPQDEFGNHECNQRMVMLYGFGKARDEARHTVKKITKEMVRLFGKKSSLDVCSGEVKKKEKKKEKGDTGGKDTESVANYEGTLAKFQKLSYYDQHALTQQCLNQVLESIQSFSSGTSQHLPLIENITYLCDLMEMCYNINGLVEFLVELLKELPEVDNQLNKKKSNLEGSYCSSLCLCAVSVLRRYHPYLLVTNELTCSVFESLCNIVKHVGNPADCTSAERCILAYLYDLFTTSYHVKTKFQELFSGASAKVKAALFAAVSPSVSNHSWDPAYMAELIENPRLRIEPSLVKQILDPGNRYSFVCNIIHNICSTSSVERLNELTIMSAELTSMCNPLSYEWLGVLKALCCSTNSAPLSQGVKDMGWSKNCGFMDILFQIEVSDYNIHDCLAIFSALLVARHCFSIEDIIIHVALPSLLSHPGAPSDTEAEQGARLTCHLLLRLFQTAHVHPNITPEIRKHNMYIKSSTDRHLLDAAHEACEIGAIVAVLKALIMLSDSIGSSVKKSDSERDIIQTMLKSLEDDEDDDDLGMGLGMPGYNSRNKGVEHAGLSEYSRHVLKEICSQEWVREKFLKDPEALLTSDLLLDNMLSHNQAQQLVHLICYPEGVPSLPPIDEDDDLNSEQKRNISRILNNMDQWKLRVSWLELQLMFKQTPSSEMDALLENVSEATVEVFTNETMKPNEVVPPPQTLWTENEKESIWLIAPLISKLSSTVQGRVLKAAGEELKTGNNFWTAKNADEKEQYLQKSISLMGHQPFLSLVLTCLKGQDEQREGLLKSLYEQLEKFVNNTKEPQDRGIPTDDRLKLMMQESLRLRMSLVGGMFDTIQRNSSLLSEWTNILIQLLSYGVVTLGNSAELFMVVLDMLSVLLHGTLVVDTVEGKDDRRTYSSLVRKLRKETENKRNDSMDLVKQLLPLPKYQIEVIQNENHKVKKQQGFQVSIKQKLSPWDLLEGHKNPFPLSLSCFGAVRLERKPLKYEEQHRLLLYHTHSMKKPMSHYLDAPVLPPEDLEPPPEQKEDQNKLDPTKIVTTTDNINSINKKARRKRNRTPTGPNYNVPTVTGPGSFARPGIYDGAPVGNWATPAPYGANNPGGIPQQGPYMQQQPQHLGPSVPRFPQAPGPVPGASKAALEKMLSGRYPPQWNTRQPGMTNNMNFINNRHVIRNRLIKNNMMTHMGDGSMYGSPGMQGFGQMAPNPGMGQNFPPGYQQAPMGMDQGMGGGAPMAPQGYNTGYQSGGMQGLQPGNPQQGGYMGQQGQMGHPSKFGNMGMSSTGQIPSSNMSSMGAGSGGQMGYSNMGSSAGGYAMQSQQQRIQQMRQQQLLLQQQQQQQQGGSGGPAQHPLGGGGHHPGSGGGQSMQASQQQLLTHLQRHIPQPSGGGGQQVPQPPPPPQYGNYQQY